MDETYDYLVIGAGSAGCAVAARLSEDSDVSVCLVEAGPTHKHFSVDTPGIGIINMRKSPRNWAFETVPQPGLGGRRGYQPRGKVLGGSSGTNAMIYIRGHRADYDNWASMGLDGWSYDEVLPYFRRAENREAGANDYHGEGGPLNVTRRDDISPINQNFLDAAAQLQLPATDDFNGEQQEGAGIYDVTMKRGKRWSAARAYLDPAEGRENLCVKTGWTCAKITVDSSGPVPRATGAEFVSGRKRMRVTARREVVLSAGAFGSPHILLLSGIGAREKLAPHGIEVVHELPGVGENLHDHIDWIAVYRARPGAGLEDKTIGFSVRGGTKMMTKGLSDYRKTGTGLFASNIAESGAFLTVEPDAPSPDVQIHFCIAMIENHGRDLRWGHGYSAHVCVLRPHSRGTVELASADPTDAPLIDPNFLGDERDMELLMKGARLTQRIMQSPAMEPIRGEALHGTDAESDEELRADIVARADTVYHPVGTCRMGTDPHGEERAVVDARLRVHGMEGLRVVDASIMPQVISGNTNAPTIMIGEKAADMIREDAAALRVAAE